MIELFGGPLDGCIVADAPGMDHIAVNFGPCDHVCTGMAVYAVHGARADFVAAQPDVSPPETPPN